MKGSRGHPKFLPASSPELPRWPFDEFSLLKRSSVQGENNTSDCRHCKAMPHFALQLMRDASRLHLPTQRTRSPLSCLSPQLVIMQIGRYHLAEIVPADARFNGLIPFHPYIWREQSVAKA